MPPPQYCSLMAKKLPVSIALFTVCMSNLTAFLKYFGTSASIVKKKISLPALAISVARNPLEVMTLQKGNLNFWLSFIISLFDRMSSRSVADTHF